jgi:hypothetical protein
VSANRVWPRLRHACLSGDHVRIVPHKRRKAGSSADSRAVGGLLRLRLQDPLSSLAVEIHAPRLRRRAIASSSHRSVATAVTGEPHLAAFGPHFPPSFHSLERSDTETSDTALCSLLFAFRFSLFDSLGVRALV